MTSSRNNIYKGLTIKDVRSQWRRGLSQCGQEGGGGKIFRDFVPASFMDGLSRIHAKLKKCLHSFKLHFHLSKQIHIIEIIYHVFKLLK